MLPNCTERLTIKIISPITCIDFKISLFFEILVQRASLIYFSDKFSSNMFENIDQFVYLFVIVKITQELPGLMRQFIICNSIKYPTNKNFQIWGLHFCHLVLHLQHVIYLNYSHILGRVSCYEPQIIFLELQSAFSIYLFPKNLKVLILHFRSTIYLLTHIHYYYYLPLLRTLGNVLTDIYLIRKLTKLLEHNNLFSSVQDKNIHRTINSKSGYESKQEV